MRLSIRQKLLGALALDLLLMMALGTFAWMQMARMNARASMVGERVIPTLRNVDRIHDVLSEYRRRQLEYMLFDNPADKARLEGEMGELEATMSQAIEAQIAYLPTGQTDALEEMRIAWQSFVRSNHRTFLPTTRGGNTGSVQPAFTRLEPLYSRLMDASQRLADLGEEQAEDALAEVRSTYHESRIFIFGETLLTLAISAAIGFFLATHMARRVGALTSATLAVAGGDLDRDVVVSGGDELETLGRNFNHMVARLRSKHAALVERNSELSQSLERQRQLTEDLVARRRAEEAALRARSAAEAASQAKSLFLATMSHELRTPLNAILGYTQILQLEAEQRRQAGILPELGRIQLAGRHLLGLISNVLDFSKIEQGKLELAWTEIEVATLAREVTAILEPLARQNGNQWRLECPPDLGTLRTDPVKLRQILFNLLSNAVKFTENGTVTLKIERHAGNLPGHGGTGAELTLKVIDTGIGIHPRDRDKLFQPFGQIDPGGQSRFDGTGLGLVVSQELCQAMGGEIRVESTPGKGSAFTVHLPIHDPASEQNDSTPEPTADRRRPALPIEVRRHGERRTQHHR